MATLPYVTTKQVDDGLSADGIGNRFSKADVFFELLGDLDELTSSLGVVKATITIGELVNRDELIEMIATIQTTLQKIGGDIAFVHKADRKPLFKDEMLVELESWEVKLSEELDHYAVFLLPGVNLLSAHTDVARTISRRMERSYHKFLAKIGDDKNNLPTQITAYLNRLSDFLFIMARYLGES